MLKQIGHDGIDEIVDAASELDGWAELVVAAGHVDGITEDTWDLVAKGLERTADRLRGVCGVGDARALSTDEG